MAIPVQVENEVITGKSLRSETCGMEFNASVVKAVTSTLYNYKKEAVVREYSTNITDAHTDAGFPDKIGYVQVPTAMNPVIEFHDKGTGLSVEDVYSIFTVLGRSTKRGDNTTSGSLGFGSKSYVAVSDQMTVSSVKNGKKIIVLCYMNRQGELAADLKSEIDTTEENGTIISIPVKPSEVSSWQEACARVLGAFRNPHKVNTFGDYQKTYDELRKVCEDVRKEESVFIQDPNTILRNHRANQLVLMGDILYELPDFNSLIGKTKIKTLAENFLDKGFYVTSFNIGDIDHAPSREAVSYDPSTFIKLRKRVNHDINKYYKDFTKDLGDVGGINYYNFYHKFYSTPVWETLQDMVLPFTKGYALKFTDPIRKGGSYWTNYCSLNILSGFEKIRGFIPSVQGGCTVFSSDIQVLDQSRILKIKSPVIVFSEKEKGLYKMKQTLENVQDKFDNHVLYVENEHAAHRLHKWFGEGKVLCGDVYSPEKTKLKKGQKSRTNYDIKEDYETVATYIKILDNGWEKKTGKVDLSQGNVYYTDKHELVIKGVVAKEVTRFSVGYNDNTFVKMLHILGGTGSILVFKNKNNSGKISRSGIPSLSKEIAEVIKSKKKEIISHLAWNFNPEVNLGTKELLVVEGKSVYKKFLDRKDKSVSDCPIVTSLLEISRFNLDKTRMYLQQKEQKDKLYDKVKSQAKEVLSNLPLAGMFSCYSDENIENYKHYLKLEKVIK